MADFWKKHAGVSGEIRSLRQIFSEASQGRYDYVGGDVLNLYKIVSRMPLEDRMIARAQWELLRQPVGEKALECLKATASQGRNSLSHAEAVMPFLDSSDPGLDQAIVTDIAVQKVLLGYFRENAQTLCKATTGISQGDGARALAALDDFHDKVEAGTTPEAMMRVLIQRKTPEAALRNVRALSAVSRIQAGGMIDYAEKQAALARAGLRAMVFLIYDHRPSESDPLREQRMQRIQDAALMISRALSAGEYILDLSGMLRRDAANMESMKRPFFARLPS